jgi:hypothetical protein
MSVDQARAVVDANAKQALKRRMWYNQIGSKYSAGVL